MKVRGSLFLVIMCGFSAFHWLQASDDPTAGRRQSQDQDSSATQATVEKSAFLKERETLIADHLKGATIAQGSLTLPPTTGLDSERLTRQWVAWHDSTSVWIDVQDTIPAQVASDLFRGWPLVLSNQAVSFNLTAEVQTPGEWQVAIERFREVMAERNVAITTDP